MGPGFGGILVSSQKLWSSYPGAPVLKLREKSFGAQVGKISHRRPNRFFSQFVSGRFGLSESTTTSGTVIGFWG